MANPSDHSDLFDQEKALPPGLESPPDISSASPSPSRSPSAADSTSSSQTRLNTPSHHHHASQEKTLPAVVQAPLSLWHRVLDFVSDPPVKGDPRPPPDGGWTAWSQVIGAGCIIAATWGYVTSFGVFQEYFEEHLNESASNISWVGSLQIFLLFALSTFSGRALDAGFLRVTLVFGMLLQLLGIFATSVAGKFDHLFLAQGVALGIGNALQFCPAVSLVSTYFDRNKTFALSLAAAGSACGSMLFAGIVKGVLHKIGFPWTVRVLGFIILALDLIAMALLRIRLPPRRTGPLVEWAAFKEKPYVLYCGGMFFVFWGVYFAFFYVGQFSKSVIGFSYIESLNLLLVLNGAGLIGRILPGYIADRYIGSLNTVFPVCAFLGVMTFVWAGIHDSVGIYIFAVFYGIAAAAAQAMWAATLSGLTADSSRAGTRMGMGFTLVSLACLTGNPIGGALITLQNGKYIGAQMFAGSAIAIGSALLVCARISKSGWVWKAKV